MKIEYGKTKKANLTNIKIPNSVTSIGDGAFLYCESLTSIKVARDSYAAKWASELEYDYEYSDAHNWLNN